MQGVQPPVSISMKCALPQFGVQKQYCKMGFVTLESDKYVCVRQKVGAAGQLTIVDLAAGTSENKPWDVDGAIMNPNTKVLAVRGTGAKSNALQVWNLDMQSRIKAHKMTEPVKFWRWLSNNVIAIVTETSIYHWSLQAEGAPQKVADRKPDLNGCQIVAYDASSDFSWSALVGWTKGANGGVEGRIQVSSKKDGKTQALKGHVLTFAEVDDRDLLCFVMQDPSGGAAPVMVVKQVSCRDSVKVSAISYLFSFRALLLFFVFAQYVCPCIHISFIYPSNPSIHPSIHPSFSFLSFLVFPPFLSSFHSICTLQFISHAMLAGTTRDQSLLSPALERSFRLRRLNARHSQVRCPLHVHEERLSLRHRHPHSRLFLRKQQY